MKKNKSSISESSSYEEIGELWDSHDLTEYESHLKEINFEIDIKKEKTYCALDGEVSKRLLILANKKGVAPDILVNLLLQEKLKSINE